MFARLVLTLLCLSPLCGGAERPFAIQVVDKGTGRSVPMVELETVHGMLWVTDNTGVAAIDAAELFGREVFFHVRSHGYQVREDGFGYRGRRFKVAPGGKGRIEIERINIAERVRRLTGAGLKAEMATMNGEPDPVRAGVAGCDSVQNAIYGGRLFWVWGDTSRLSYPLGNFQTTAATSAVGEVEPEFRFFQNGDGFVKGVAPIPGEGPTWLSGLATLRDADGNEHLVATYVKIRNMLEVYERGLCEWDPAAEEFQRVLVFEEGATLYPDGHAFAHEDWMYFAEAVPTMRIPASYEAWKDPARYEAVKAKVDFTDAAGKVIKHHRGSVQWNPFRMRWVSVFCEEGGESSYLGEIWYAEADAPEGPWMKAVKVVTHDRYSFYNPSQHPWWTRDGRYLYFEGTFTKTFSKSDRGLPRYDYNQILYRIDLGAEIFTR